MSELLAPSTPLPFSAVACGLGLEIGIITSASGLIIGSGAAAS
jgi:hypothetical protein